MDARSTNSGTLIGNRLRVTGGVWYGRDGPTYLQPAMAAGTLSAHARMGAHVGEGGRRGVALGGCGWVVRGTCRSWPQLSKLILFDHISHTQFHTPNTATEVMASFQLCGHSADEKL